VAACISWRLRAHYRGGHPRTYLPGIPDSAKVNVDEWSGSFTAAAVSAANAFKNDCNSAGSGTVTDTQLGTVSFVHAGAWRTPPIFRPFVGDAFMDSRIDTQRRRLGADVAF